MTTLARWVSILGHPFVMVAVMVGMASRSWRAVLITALLTIVPMAILMFRQVRSGAWGNVDASKPQERPILFVTIGAGVIALIAFLAVSEPQSVLVRGALCTLVMVGVCAVATRWLKVSLHMAFATLAATTVPILFVFVPILAWSRLKLSRHSVTEVLAGTLIGIVTGLTIRFL